MIRIGALIPPPLPLDRIADSRVMEIVSHTQPKVTALLQSELLPRAGCRFGSFQAGC
jgi:hypothetical protein